jgi:polyhydroxybutyrate depolymerase
MTRLIISILTLLALSSPLYAADTVRGVFTHADTSRSYTIILPDTLLPSRPLVIHTHGYGSSTVEQPDLTAAALSHGFAVCYPVGTPDSRGKAGWNVGYPSQSTLTVDEADFMQAFKVYLCDTYRLNPDNVFLSGMSNGGDLCYQLIYTRPDIFKAYGSVAGLTFNNVYLNNRLTSPAPFLEIHGTADKTSMWDGDPTNSGGWGAYIPVPLAVAAIAANNKCTSLTSSPFDTLPDSSRTATIHRYEGSPSGAEVILIEIDGGKHSWAAKDINTGLILIDFFSRHLN